MKITNVKTGSAAAEWKLAKGSVLLSINGNEIADSLDYLYYVSDDHLEFLIKSPDGKTNTYEYSNDSEKQIGLEFSEDKIRCCGNKCIFCFVDQLPRGLRKSLYLKDEDYRLSFLDGNFITMTSVAEKDLKRIADFRLSPLYISVHTTNEPLRATMLGRKKLKPIMKILKRLAYDGIEMHTQIVVCPGYNDGEELQNTIDDLGDLRPNVASVGIVPVGLSDYRIGLAELKPVDRDKASEIIESFGPDTQEIYRYDGDGFVYLADEFFLLAGVALPDSEYYDDYPQFENGIGMARSFLDEFKMQKKRLKKLRNSQRLNVSLVTGMMMSPVLEKEVLPEIKKSMPLWQIDLLPVENRFLGKSITVSGLLSGDDIIRSCENAKSKPDIVVLPPNCINRDGLLIDDTTPDIIAEKLNAKVLIGSYNIVETLKNISREN